MRKIFRLNPVSLSHCSQLEQHQPWSWFKVFLSKQNVAFGSFWQFCFKSIFWILNLFFWMNSSCPHQLLVCPSRDFCISTFRQGACLINIIYSCMILHPRPAWKLERLPPLRNLTSFETGQLYQFSVKVSKLYRSVALKGLVPDLSIDCTIPLKKLHP